MDRRTVLKAGLAAAGTLATPAYLKAQSNKTISILTWNIADQDALFKQEFEDFKKANPGVEIEWLDKKGLAPHAGQSIARPPISIEKALVA